MALMPVSILVFVVLSLNKNVCLIAMSVRRASRIFNDDRTPGMARISPAAPCQMPAAVGDFCVEIIKIFIQLIRIELSFENSAMLVIF